METTCIDTVFGEMTYKHRWYKVQNESVFGKDYKIKIVAKAYTGKPITDEQRESYKLFMGKKGDFFKIAEEQLTRYINDNLREMANSWLGARRVDSTSDLTEMVEPKTLLFKQDGTILFLLECVWDEENGIAVKLFPEVDTGSQNLFL